MNFSKKNTYSSNSQPPNIDTLRPRQNGRHFADDIFKCIFLNENVWIPIKISLKFVPKVPINNIPSLIQIMVWRHPGAKPLSEPMMDSLLTHICVTWPQWVKASCDLAGIDSGYGLVPVRHQAITWTNTDSLSTGSSGTNFNEIRIKI